MTESTAKWRRINRARFKSDAAFRSWESSRRARHRAKKRRIYKAALRRHRPYLRAYLSNRYARLRGLIVWEILRRLKSHGASGGETKWDTGSVNRLHNVPHRM